jgi:hypothetical protein
MKDDWHRPRFGTHPPDWDRHHGEATQLVDGPQPQTGQTHYLGVSLYSGWRWS